MLPILISPDGKRVFVIEYVTLYEKKITPTTSLTTFPTDFTNIGLGNDKLGWDAVSLHYLGGLYSDTKYIEFSINQDNNNTDLMMLSTSHKVQHDDVRFDTKIDSVQLKRTGATPTVFIRGYKRVFTELEVPKHILGE